MSRRWLSWTSPIWPVWLWHALFDGTWVCRCEHSKHYGNPKAPCGGG